MTERITNGPTEVEFTYEKRSAFPQYSKMRIRISRDGTELVDQAVPRCDVGCIPAARFQRKLAVRFRDLDEQGEPEVLLTIFTGGANCCIRSFLYDYRDTTESYRRIVMDWGRRGYSLRDFNRDGIVEFDGADIRFDYNFSCTACNISPLRIWHFRQGSYRDVTRRFPRRIAADLKQVRRLYLRYRDDGGFAVRGILPAYAADQCLLGRCERGFRVLERAARRGEFDEKEGTFGPSGQAFVRKVKRFLRRAGYVR